MRNAIQKSALQLLGAAIASFIGALRRAGEKLRRAMLAREAATALRAMSDHELRDIGISRSEIDQRVTHPHEQRY